MKELFRKIKRCNRKIEKISESIENIETLPFYSIFNLKREQDQDIQEAYACMRDTLSEKQVYLENLIIEANKELHHVSQAQKTFTLKKA